MEHLGLVVGFGIVCSGFWLLYQLLAGRIERKHFKELETLRSAHTKKEGESAEALLVAKNSYGELVGLLQQANDVLVHKDGLIENLDLPEKAYRLDDEVKMWLRRLRRKYFENAKTLEMYQSNELGYLANAQHLSYETFEALKFFISVLSNGFVLKQSLIVYEKVFSLNYLSDRNVLLMYAGRFQYSLERCLFLGRGFLPDWVYEDIQVKVLERVGLTFLAVGDETVWVEKMFITVLGIVMPADALGLQQVVADYFLYGRVDTVFVELLEKDDFYFKVLLDRRNKALVGIDCADVVFDFFQEGLGEIMDLERYFKKQLDEMLHPATGEIGFWGLFVLVYLKLVKEKNEDSRKLYKNVLAEYLTFLVKTEMDVVFLTRPAVSVADDEDDDLPEIDGLIADDGPETQRFDKGPGLYDTNISGIPVVMDVPQDKIDPKRDDKTRRELPFGENIEGRTDPTMRLEEGGGNLVEDESSSVPALPPELLMVMSKGGG